MSFVPSPSRSETDQRRALRRNRALATALLVGAAALFFATGAISPRGFWLDLLHAGSEAAVVGALADWFAVVALFRHPLGLPFPRTAVIPKNKDRIGEGLGQFVERNFLAPEILAERLKALGVARRIAEWLARPETAAEIALRATETLPALVRSLEDQELRDFFARSFREQLREIDLAPLLGRTLAIVTASAQWDALFDRAVDAAFVALARNGERVQAMVASRSYWWIPEAIDRHIAQRITTGMEEFLADLRKPGSARRRAMREAVAAMAEELQHSPRWQERLNALKAGLLDQPEVHNWLVQVWDDLRGIVLQDLASPQSRTREAIERAALSLGRTLVADPQMQARLDAGIEHLALAVVPWRGQIATLIAEVVRSWDARTVAERIELAMGSDLQYIRMNGTLVGAAVGCLLFLAARLM